MANGDASQNPLETPNATSQTPGDAFQRMMAISKYMQSLGSGLSGGQPRPGGIAAPGMTGQSLPAPTLPTMAGAGGRPPMPGQTSAQPSQTQSQPGPPAPQPSATAASYGGPATRGAPLPSGYETGFSFPDKGARNMAVTQGAIKNLTEAVTQVKQKRWQQEAAQTEQVAMGYVTLLQKADEEQDPEKKKALLQLAEQMKSDKGVMKVLEKAHKDPMSGAAIGLQRAMQTAQAKSQQSAKLEEMRAVATKNYAEAQQKIAEAQKAQADAQRAQAEARKTDQETANLSPEAQAKVLAQKHQNDLDKIAAVEKAKLEQVKETVNGAMERNKNSVAGMLKATKMRVDGLEAIAKGRGSAKNPAADYLEKAYKSVQSRVNDLTKAHTSLQAHIDKQSLLDKHWWNTADVKTTQNKIAANEAEATRLKKTLDEIDKNRAIALSLGALPPEAVTSDEGAGGGEGTGAGTGTEDNPETIK